MSAKCAQRDGQKAEHGGNSNYCHFERSREWSGWGSRDMDGNAARVAASESGDERVKSLPLSLSAMTFAPDGWFLYKKSFRSLQARSHRENSAPLPVSKDMLQRARRG